jgi:hypothetical protein
VPVKEASCEDTRYGRYISSDSRQREQLPEAIRQLVLDDQRLRNDISGRRSTADSAWGACLCRDEPKLARYERPVVAARRARSRSMTPASPRAKLSNSRPDIGAKSARASAL